MQSIQANWEDDEKNRHVVFSVEYARESNGVEIHSLTPKQVTFLCPESNTPMRSIGVWTEKGRQLLADQIRNSGKLAQVEQEIDASLAV